MVQFFIRIYVFIVYRQFYYNEKNNYQIIFDRKNVQWPEAFNLLFTDTYFMSKKSCKILSQLYKYLQDF